jgi:phospholipase C
MIIISPYARPGFTDSNPASFDSMLAFTEHVFGLAPLNGRDARAYDYSGAFTFAVPPRSGPAMVVTPEPEQSRTWIATHPPDPTDPT